MLSDVNHEMDVGLHGLGVHHPGTAGHTKVHCLREGFVFQLYFFLVMNKKTVISRYPRKETKIVSSNMNGVVGGFGKSIDKKRGGKWGLVGYHQRQMLKFLQKKEIGKNGHFFRYI